MAVVNLFTDTDALGSSKQTKVTKTVNLLQQTFPDVVPKKTTPIAQPTPTTSPSVTVSQQENKSLFSKIADYVTSKLNSITKGGISAGIERVKQTPVSEYFLPTSKQGQPAVQYVSDTLKSAVNTIKGAGKVSPAYTLYRAVTGNPVTPKEYLNDALEALNTFWRVQPIAPTFGAASNLIKTLRQKAQGKDVSWEDIVTAPVKGINEQPGIGEVFTDNAKWAQAIDIAFMATMIAKPFVSKKLNQLNIKSTEINQMKSVLGVEPNASMKKVAEVFKAKMKEIPDTFTSNPSPENMALRKELTNAYNILKRANVIEQKYAEAFDFIQRKLGIDTTKVETSKVEPKQLGNGEIQPEVTKITPKQGDTLSAKILKTDETVTGTVLKVTETTPNNSVAVMRLSDNSVKVVPVQHTQWSTPEQAAEAKKTVVMDEYIKQKYPGEQPKTPSKIAKSIEQKAIEQKLTKGFEGLAGYDKITIKDQSQKASALMKDYEKASKVIRGIEPLPTGLRGTSLITAAEEYIKETGDAKLAYELANSPLVSETSAAAQELRLAAERQPDSLTLKLQELRKLREQAVQSKTGKKVNRAIQLEVEKIKTETKSKAPKKEDWSSFIKSIEC